MEVSSKITFQCDGCARQEDSEIYGGDTTLPEGWNRHYFYGLGGDRNNLAFDFCSKKCFLKELDKRLKEERKKHCDIYEGGI